MTAVLAAWLMVPACAPKAPDGGGEPASTEQDVVVGPTEPAYSVARGLLRQALEALGEDALADGLVVRASGTLDQAVELQGRAPGSRDPVPFREALAVDPSSGRVAWEYRQERIDGTTEWIREIYRGPREHLILILEDGFSVLLLSPSHEEARRRISRRLPAVLVAEALDSPTGLRDLGTRQGLRAIAASLQDGTGVTLLLDPVSGLPRRVETLIDVPGLGDTVVGQEWLQYEAREGSVLPARYRVTVDDRVYTDMTVEAVEHGAAVEAFMTRPDDVAPPDEVELPEQPDPAARASVREVASGVHVVVGLRAGFHPMFVETDSGIVAVDAPSGYPVLHQLPPGDVAPAPSGSWLSARYLELIRETVPDQPVRSVVLTHFHGDHVGGLRAFVAAGAEIIATAAAVPGIERLLASPHTLGPDPLAGAPVEPRIRTVEGTLRIDDPSRPLEIVDVGANPHSEQMLIVHLPAQDLLYVADLLTAAPLERFPTPSHERLDRFFASWLTARDLAPARIFTSHGNLLVTPEHLAKLAPGSGS